MFVRAKNGQWAVSTTRCRHCAAGIAATAWLCRVASRRASDIDEAAVDAMLDLLQAVLDGLLFGAIYALIGIGFTLVFGVMHKLNMAYAAASIGGAYCGLLVIGSGVRRAAVGGVPRGVPRRRRARLPRLLTCFHFIPLASPLATLMSTVGMLLLIDEIIVHATDGMPATIRRWSTTTCCGWASSAPRRPAGRASP